MISAAALPALSRRAPAAPGFSAASIAGTWTWSYSGKLVRNQFASIGIATFDGKGGCSILLKENSGVNRSYDHKSVSCSYEVQKNGTGEADFSLDGEEGLIAFSVAGNEIAFVSPETGVVAAGIMRRGARVVNKEPVGDWSLLLDGTIYGERATGSGMMTFHRGGKCSQSLVFNLGTGSQPLTTESCTYQVDDKGFGLLDITYDNGTGGDAHFVVSDRGRRMTLLTAARGEILLGSGLRR